MFLIILLFLALLGVPFGLLVLLGVIKLVF